MERKICSHKDTVSISIDNLDESQVELFGSVKYDEVSYSGTPFRSFFNGIYRLQLQS